MSEPWGTRVRKAYCVAVCYASLCDPDPGFTHGFLQKRLVHQLTGKLGFYCKKGFINSRGFENVSIRVHCFLIQMDQAILCKAID
jgi:hypothetical protein